MRIGTILGCFLMATTTIPVFSLEVFEGSQWLRDPVFDGVPIVQVFHRANAPKPKLSGPTNIHTLFRKEIMLRAKPVKAALAITGDDYYKFYVNGDFVVQGPEGGYPTAYPHYWLEISSFLEEGVNCLAAHAFYQGLYNRVWVSGDNRSGFMAALEVTYPDGVQERFVTDTSWRCHALEAFPGEETTGYQTQFLEHMDMRRYPKGWREAGFDDTAWTAPLVGRQDHVFTPQITPPLQHRMARPTIARKVGEGRYFYDFGTEIVGHTRIRIQGPEGHVLIVRHGEELWEDGSVRHEMRANCNYEERPVLSGDMDLIEFYDYRAFRYLEILDAPAEPDVWVDVRHYPFDPEKSSLRSSDALLEGIWTICRNGVQMGSQGGFLDCPSREKGQYLGDAVMAARSHLWLTGDPSLTKKCLDDFAQSRFIHEGLMGVAPCSFSQEIAEYSLQWVLLLQEYYRFTGDRKFTASMMDAVLPGLFQYFASFENEAGLIENMREKWVVVDWPKNLRDNYDYDYAEDKANTVLNAFYYGALRAAAALCRELGRDGAAYDARADRVAQGFAAHLVDSDTGCYVDAPGSSHSSLHANAIPLAFGLHAGADRAAMLDLIRNKRLSCGVYIAAYVIEACFRNGEPDLAYDLITSKDERSWHEMLRHGATTCMEAWGPDQKWNTSWCHPWSSSPIYLIAEYVMGLGPARPGWHAVRVAPAKIANLPQITLTAPHPRGRITARHVPGKGYCITLPPGVPAEVHAPEGVPIMIKHEESHADSTFSPEDMAFLQGQGWNDHVGQGLGVWVSVDRQMLYLIENGVAVWQARCATAAAGPGTAAGSMQTPLGWHQVAEKVGEGAPWGQVFRSRVPTKEIWRPGDDLGEDLVLTRLLWLEGLEPGKNKGKNEAGISVDSRERCIYIHGTNDETRIGAPSSHGCIRLLNDDVIVAYERIPVGAPVLITQQN